MCFENFLPYNAYFKVGKIAKRDSVRTPIE